MYLLVHQTENRFKIGKSVRPKSRIAQLPERTSLDWARSLQVKLPDARRASQVESMLHKALAEFRLERLPCNGSAALWLEAHSWDGATEWLSSMVIGGGLLRGLQSPSPWAEKLLEQLCAGKAVIAFAHLGTGSRHFGQDDENTRLRRLDDGRWLLDGSKSSVTCAPWATHLLVTAREIDRPGAAVAFVPADADGITQRTYRTIDDGMAPEVLLQGVVVPADHVITEADGARELLARVLDQATLGVCAEALGVCRRLLSDTIDYLRQREQFGVAIATFQAVQQRIADMYIALETASGLVRAVLGTLDGPNDARSMAVSAAKVVANKACRAVGQGAVQLHGAMDMTAELAVGHYFRRATMLESQFGSTDFHLARIERLHEAP